MSPAWISLGALLLIILLSRQERVNVGFLAIGLACVIGLYFAKMSFFDVAQAFPLSLFRVLFGVIFLFSLAQVNGTLDEIAHLMLRLAKGKVFFLPVIFFILPLVLAAIGPGNIGAVALLAPLAMAVAGKTGISAFFMTLMVVNGANAGTFSPFSPTGIISNGLIARLGLSMDPWTQVFLPSLLAQSFIALCWYIILVRRMRAKQAASNFNIDKIVKPAAPLNDRQMATIFVIVVLIFGVMAFHLDIGFLSLGLAAFLIFTKIANAKKAFLAVPWQVIIMVCGVSMLINVMEKIGGLDLFTSFLAKISNPTNVKDPLG